MSAMHIFQAIVLLAASSAAATAFAQVYRWVDRDGVTHYSDQKPAEADARSRAQEVPDRVSVYSTDPALQQAVEAQRQNRNRAPVPSDTQRQQPPVVVQQIVPPANDASCTQFDCSTNVGVWFPAAPVAGGRRWPPRNQVGVLPANSGQPVIANSSAIPGAAPPFPPQCTPGPGLRMTPPPGWQPIDPPVSRPRR